VLSRLIVLQEIDMFCPFCAVQLGDAPKFCPSCGQNVGFLTQLPSTPSTSSSEGCGPTVEASEEDLIRDLFRKGHSYTRICDIFGGQNTG
ncbi:unnamed protein product, partial [Gadus morhua 'NCC']